MSLHCPKCGGLVYARSNTKCGHCGAGLSAEFGFTDAELAAEAARIRSLDRMQKPQISVIAIVCWVIVAAGNIYLGVINHRWIYWAFAVGWVGVLTERLVRHSRKLKKYESQKDAA